MQSSGTMCREIHEASASVARHTVLQLTFLSVGRVQSKIIHRSVTSSYIIIISIKYSTYVYVPAWSVFTPASPQT